MPNYLEIIINHYKDPYETTSMSCHPTAAFGHLPRQLIPNKYHVPHELFALMEYLSVVRVGKG